MSISVRLDRDSVCLADDIDPHEVELTLPDDTTIGGLASAVRTMGYLPLIGGDKATWVLSVQQEKVAVIAQQWKRPGFLVDEHTRLAELSGYRPILARFTYRTQEDPLVVLQRLLE